MMNNDYDPAKTAGDLEFHHCMSVHCPICGPSGNVTLIDHNAKGILESALHPLTIPQRAELGSEHDAHRQGIYGTNSAGDFD